MIPKIIHYCWFGGNELPGLAIHCINSWKKYLPEYEIKEWNESNVDLNENVYIKEAYENKKWAFITDYIRLKVMYEYGGIYMDTDVEVLKPLDEFLKNEAFSGYETDEYVPTGIMASVKRQRFIEKLLTYYSDRHFVDTDGILDMTTNVKIITNIAVNYGLNPNNTKQIIEGMCFYPKDFFCPKDRVDGVVYATENTACIHHFNGSWLSREEQWEENTKQKYRRKYGERTGLFIFKLVKYGTNPKRFFRRVFKGN